MTHPYSGQLLGVAHSVDQLHYVMKKISGEQRPKVVKRKLTEKYPWLQADDQLTEDFINALDDDEQQEVCHQLNRRTEFKVLRTTYGMFNVENEKRENP